MGHEAYAHVRYLEKAVDTAEEGVLPYVVTVDRARVSDAATMTAGPLEDAEDAHPM